MPLLNRALESATASVPAWEFRLPKDYIRLHVCAFFDANSPQFLPRPRIAAHLQREIRTKMTLLVLCYALEYGQEEVPEVESLTRAILRAGCFHRATFHWATQ